MIEERDKADAELKNRQIDDGHANILREKLRAIERRLEYVFPFFHSEAVHWHAARFRVFLMKR
jgi:hypothetical protein